jgi:hypothetical protein
MPNPSFWPALAACGVAALLIGVMLVPKLGPWGIIAGGLLLLFSIYNWAFEPA